MPGPGGILALDLSSWSGWAYGCRNDPQPVSGTWRLAPGSLGRLLASFENELEDAITLHRPGLIMAEAPLPPTARSNAATWRQQLSLAGCAECAAYRHSIPFREQAASTMRTLILGTCRFPAGNSKAVVMAHMDKLGWRVADHNAGDACVVWLYAVKKLSHSTVAHLPMAQAPAL